MTRSEKVNKQRDYPLFDWKSQIEGNIEIDLGIFSSFIGLLNFIEEVFLLNIIWVGTAFSCCFKELFNDFIRIPFFQFN